MSALRKPIGETNARRNEETSPQSNGRTFRREAPHKFLSPVSCPLNTKPRPRALNFIRPKQQTPELCLEAVRIDGLALQWVKIPQTPEICQAAVAQNPRAERYVKDKSMLLPPRRIEKSKEP